MIIIVAASGRADEIKEEIRQQPIQELFRTDLVYTQEAGELQFKLASTFVLTTQTSSPRGREKSMSHDILTPLFAQPRNGKYVPLLERAQDDQIVVAPTLIRQLPLPVRRLIGDLSETERVSTALDLPPAPHRP